MSKTSPPAFPPGYFSRDADLYRAASRRDEMAKIYEAAARYAAALHEAVYGTRRPR